MSHQLLTVERIFGLQEIRLMELLQPVDPPGFRVFYEKIFKTKFQSGKCALPLIPTNLNLHWLERVM